ncbi:MAG TPA: hypothetical protein VM578_06765 [Candidatus Saccharimonadales bacterium]|nr:hypothetical protein [Candidatus Saccharimonadales bacterium]
MTEWNVDWNPLVEEPDHKPVESIAILGFKVKLGDRVRLCPQKTADIMDMALRGKIAIIEAIECDFDNRMHLAVVLEDDPGRDLGMMRQPGHRFFFSPDEVAPLSRLGEVPDER